MAWLLPKKYKWQTRRVSVRAIVLARLWIWLGWGFLQQPSPFIRTGRKSSMFTLLRVKHLHPTFGWRWARLEWSPVSVILSIKVIAFERYNIRLYICGRRPMKGWARKPTGRRRPREARQGWWRAKLYNKGYKGQTFGVSVRAIAADNLSHMGHFTLSGMSLFTKT